MDAAVDPADPGAWEHLSALLEEGADWGAASLLDDMPVAQGAPPVEQLMRASATDIARDAFFTQQPQLLLSPAEAGGAFTVAGGTPATVLVHTLSSPLEADPLLLMPHFSAGTGSGSPRSSRRSGGGGSSRSSSSRRSASSSSSRRARSEAARAAAGPALDEGDGAGGDALASLEPPVSDAALAAAAEGAVRAAERDGALFEAPLGMLDGGAGGLLLPPEGGSGVVEGRRRSSRFRGVTKHRRSGRWEAHIWVRDSGKQVYLGGYELEEHAAEAFDVVALKCKGPKVKLNYDASKYSELSEYLASVSLDELVAAVRRQSQGFARGSSAYRGVTQHPNGRWEARLGVPGSKHVYLGLFNAEADAARAYDRALVLLRGSAASTNFPLSAYEDEMQQHQRAQAQAQQHAAAEAAAAEPALLDAAGGGSADAAQFWLAAGGGANDDNLAAFSAEPLWTPDA